MRMTIRLIVIVLAGFGAKTLYERYSTRLEPLAQDFARAVGIDNKFANRAPKSGHMQAETVDTGDGQEQAVAAADMEKMLGYARYTGRIP
jgi:hypothetical protein